MSFFVFIDNKGCTSTSVTSKGYNSFVRLIHSHNLSKNEYPFPFQVFPEKSVSSLSVLIHDHCK